MGLTLDRLPPHRVRVPGKGMKKVPVWKKAWAERLGGTTTSSRSAKAIIEEYERAVKTAQEDKPLLPCVSPEANARLETAGSCAAVGAHRAYVGGRAAARFLWLAACVAYAFASKVVAACRAAVAGVGATARATVEVGRASVAAADAAKRFFVASSTASFLVAGLVLEGLIKFYALVRARAEPTLRSRAPLASKWLFPSPKKDEVHPLLLDLESSLPGSPRKGAAPETPLPAPRWVKTPKDDK